MEGSQSKLSKGKTKRQVSCSICSLTFSGKSNLKRHLKAQHKLTFENEFQNKTFVFYCEEDFKKWKYEEEKATNSSFVKTSGTSKYANGTEVCYYRCHRSGMYEPLKNRKRNLKVKGSIKIGKKCPARMKVFKMSLFGGVETTVTYTSDHRGHELDPKQLRLATPEKELIATKLSQGFTKQQVIRNLRSSSNSSKRSAQITRKDIHNVCASFRYTTPKTNGESSANLVNLIVSKLEAERDSPIILYKPQGLTHEIMPQFGEKDYVLGIMNDVQLELLAFYGNNVVQVNTIHGPNRNILQLTTLMVSVSDEEGIPVAILFSNKKSTEVYETFFSAIRYQLEMIHKSISPFVFLSDNNSVLISSWTKIFGLSDKQLFSSWQVKQDFIANVKRKIISLDYRESVLRELDSLQYETDELTFPLLLKSFSDKWSSTDETKIFAKYFEDKYVKDPEKWGECFRQDITISCNMKPDRWHREINYNETEGQLMTALDKDPTVVMTAVKRLVHRAVCLYHPTLSRTCATSDQYHSRSLELPSDGISQAEKEKLWFFPSTDSLIQRIHEVRQINDKCEFNCDTHCDLCYSCIHEYECSCPDNCMKFIMCEHIHKISTLFPKSVEPVADDCFDIAFDEDDFISEEACTEDISSLMTAKKSQCVSLLNEVIAQLGAATCVEHFDVIERSARQMLSDLKSFCLPNQVNPNRTDKDQ